MPSQPCPACGSELPVDPRFVTWCHSCGWNLAPGDGVEPSGRFDLVAALVGRRVGDRLADRLAESDRLAPRWTAAKAAAYGIALTVHLLLLALIVLAGWLLVTQGLFLQIGGALLLGLAYLMRPRFGRRPSENVVARDAAPALYALVDEIAASMQARSAQTILVTSEFNASWSTVGIRRERVLVLGLPLLAVLRPQEQVALIAHELAHGRNGDATRGRVVGTAIESLVQLYVTLVPGWTQLGGTELDAAELVVRPVLWLLAQPIRLLLMLELHLLLHDMKRAEYLADRLAAEAAGTDAAVGALEKLLLEQTAAVAVQQYVVARRTAEGDVFDALDRSVAGVPERERERRRRIARLEEARLSATHPPTGKRIELLERRPATAAAVTLDERRRAAINAELRLLRPALSSRIVDQYRAALEG